MRAAPYFSQFFKFENIIGIIVLFSTSSSLVTMRIGHAEWTCGVDMRMSTEWLVKFGAPVKLAFFFFLGLQRAVRALLSTA